MGAGNGQSSREPGLTERQVRERLLQGAERRLPEDMREPDAVGQALLGLVQWVTALQETAVFLAAEIDRLRHQD